jgi:DNA invertase Pin-like site-specific DNA recombinase
MNKEYGYGRVSSREQHLDRQIEALRAHGVDERDIITDKQSGKDFDRPGYIALTQNMLRPGDTLVIKELDRLGRDYEQIKQEWQKLRQRGIDVIVLDTPIINTANKSDLEKSLISNIVFEIMAYTAEKERQKIRQRQREGIDAAKEKGQHLGRPKAVYPPEWPTVYIAWQKGQLTARAAMAMLGLKKSTYYKLVESYRSEGN